MPAQHSANESSCSLTSTHVHSSQPQRHSSNLLDRARFDLGIADEASLVRTSTPQKLGRRADPSIGLAHASMRVSATTARRCVGLLGPRRWLSSGSAAPGFTAATAVGSTEAERSRRAQQLFFVRRGTERAQDGMEVWGMQQRKRWSRRTMDGASPARPSEPPVKRPSDSLLTLVLPFGSDRQLCDLYLNAAGNLRIGRLLEDLDSFAGQIAYTHADDPDDPDAEPLTLVTASLDRIDLVEPIPTGRDLQLRGCCAWVGSSSMSILVSLSVLPDSTKPDRLAEAGSTSSASSSSSAASSSTASSAASSAVASTTIPQPLLHASFTYVARDRLNNAVSVPRLEPQTAEEHRWFSYARDAQLARRAARKTLLDKTAPTSAELELVHSVFMAERQAAEVSESASGARRRHRFAAAPPVYVSDTTMTSTVVVMPQDRNIHGKAFGGWLLRQAFELAWACALSFGESYPTFVALSDIAFLRPVEIGTVLTFSASVEYAPGAPHRTAAVSVETRALDPRAPAAPSPTTNAFHFTFEFADPAAPPLLPVYPRTYADAMSWIAAHRRSVEGRALRARWTADGGPPAWF